MGPGYTIAAEIGDIARFPTADQLTGYIGLCLRVYQSSGRDRRGPLSKQGQEMNYAPRFRSVLATAHHRGVP